MRGRPYLRSGVLALQNVFNLARERKKYQKSEGNHQGCDKNGNHPPALQRRLVQKVFLQARNEHAPKQRPPDLRTSS